MNIKTIVDKIPKEADINPSEYTVEDRIIDVNSEYLKLIEKATQIGSIEPISGAESLVETFSIVEGSNTHLREIKDVPVERVDYRAEGATKWCRMDRDQSRAVNVFCGCGIKFFANEKQIMIEQGRPGEVRVTYVHGDVTTFTLADYNAGNPPSPTWLPEVYHDLLWLYPALKMARFYKTNRVNGLIEMIAPLQTMFNNRYGRNATQNSKFKTESTCCRGGDNYR